MVFAGTGAIITNDITNGRIGIVGIALTFGMIVMAMIYLLGPVSGAHLNPAVTLAFWITGEKSVQQSAGYLICQFSGAIVASALLHLLFPQHLTLGATLPIGSALQSFVIEIFATFLLVCSILMVANRSASALTAGMVIGSIIALEAIFAGPISGASMNPARSLGPALVSGQLHHLWIYLTAPLIGALLAVPASHLFRPEKWLTARLNKF